MDGGYVFAAGGTGGHLFPAIAVIEELKRKEPQARIRLFGSSRALEKRILANTDLEHLPLPIKSTTRGRLGKLQSLSSLAKAFRAARKEMKSAPPRVVIGCGGLISVPTLMAARWLRIPIVLLEQNVLPGRANRFLSRWAKQICLSFDESRKHFSSQLCFQVTGNPVRQAFRPSETVTASTLSKTSPTSSPGPTLLILGGSLGAAGINSAVLKMLEVEQNKLRGWRIIHQTGDRDLTRVQQAYARLGIEAEVVPFLEEMAVAIRSATIVVSRAGATTLAEIACVGRPLIVVPWPLSLDDHQTENARWYSDQKAAVVANETDQPDVKAGSVPLRQAVVTLVENESLRAELSERLRSVATPSAAANVAEILRNIQE